MCILTKPNLIRFVFNGYNIRFEMAKNKLLFFLASLLTNFYQLPFQRKITIERITIDEIKTNSPPKKMFHQL